MDSFSDVCLGNAWIFGRNFCKGHAKKETGTLHFGGIGRSVIFAHPGCLDNHLGRRNISVFALSGSCCNGGTYHHRVCGFQCYFSYFPGKTHRRKTGTHKKEVRSVYYMICSKSGCPVLIEKNERKRYM